MSDAGGSREPAGVLVVDKPAGPTSFDVVKRVRRALRAEKAGHAGTLDPAATGVLAVCVGDAVKLQHWLADGDKTYDATVAFGAATSTEDAEGEVTSRGDPARVTAGALAEALPRFVGELAQVPPMYSAVRVGGRRLHEAARAGEEVERAPRTVRVHALELGDVAPPDGGLVLARIRVRCGKGTYVRTLAADLGRALGVPAHLAALRRVEASGFRVDEAIPLEDAEALGRSGGPDALRARLVPLAEALRGLPAVAVDAAEARALAQGKVLPREAPAGELFRAIGPGGRLVAICARGAGGVKPVRGFVTPGEL